MQEEKIFAGKVLRLHVCTMEGAEWLEEVPEDTTVEKLKERCLKHVRRGVPSPRGPPLAGSRVVRRAGRERRARGGCEAEIAPKSLRFLPYAACSGPGLKIMVGVEGRQVPV